MPLPKPDIDGWVAVESSAIAAVSWSPYGGLFVQFRDGSVYRYGTASIEIAMELASDPSPGSYFNAYVRPLHAGLSTTRSFRKQAMKFERQDYGRRK
jgi:KTSC domain